MAIAFPNHRRASTRPSKGRSCFSSSFGAADVTFSYANCVYEQKMTVCLVCVGITTSSPISFHLHANHQRRWSTTTSRHSSPSSVSGSVGSANSNSYPLVVLRLLAQQPRTLPESKWRVRAASLTLGYVVHASVPTFLPLTGFDRRGAFDFRSTFVAYE